MRPPPTPVFAVIGGVASSVAIVALGLSLEDAHPVASAIGVAIEAGAALLFGFFFYAAPGWMIGAAIDEYLDRTVFNPPPTLTPQQRAAA